jgi:iron complex transport system permease protein
MIKTTAAPLARPPAKTASATAYAPAARARTSAKNIGMLAALAALVLIAAVLYMFVSVDPKFFAFAMKLRLPKLTAMMLTAFAIGGATIVFQSIINNTVVTPCLLGMNSLYTLVHTSIVFTLSTSSVIYTNRNLAFAVDLVVMVAAATLIYGYLFKKTRYNVLYVLLVGTVLTSFFSSIQTTLIRVMDPNEYDALLTTLVASFSNVNADIIAFSAILMAAVIFALRNEIALLNVITLGKQQAISLGVDYDKTIRKLLVGVTVCIAIATALVGPISFLGLILANLSRQMFKTYKHSFLMAGSALIGMLALVAGQMVVEHVFVYSIPVSVFITVGGGAYFLYLLLRKTGGTSH